MRVDEQSAVELKIQIDDLLNLYEGERSNRGYYYGLRKMVYNGDLNPKVGEGHELIKTRLATAIADKMSSYIGTQIPRINLKPLDMNNDEEGYWAEYWEKEFSYILKLSKFKQLYLDTNEIGSRLGDGFIVMETRNGLPYFYTVRRPENVMLGWRTDNLDEIEWWCYFYGLTKQAAKVQFKKDFEATSAERMSLTSSAGDGHGDPYLFDSIFDMPNSTKDIKMVQIADFNAMEDVSERIKAGDNVAIVNKNPLEHNVGKAKLLYHFIANSMPDMPTGICDFEHAAEMIVKMDEELSKQSDVNTQGAYPKFLTTQRNTKEMEQGLKPGKTQIIKISDEANAKFEVIKTQGNTYNAEPLLKNILNIIRTTSNLQELGQDQISPNISGRALTMVFQGVIQSVQKKRIRWETILSQMAVDAISELARKNPKMSETVFNEDGSFKFDVEVVWPEVLESDKASQVATTQSMRSGPTPLISRYSAMQLLGVVDPIQEEKRIKKEMMEDMQWQQAMAGTEMQPSGSEGPILSESDNQGEGIASSPGFAGSAQQSISPEGQQAMTNQQGGA